MKHLFLLLTPIGFWLTSGCVGSPKDFDVVSTTFDANTLPLNPKWGAQAARNTIPNPKVSCPWDSDSDNPDDWTKSPQYPNCTSFPISFNGGFFCGPHVNFEPVTYEGAVRWDAHAFWDDDYDLNVTRDDAALYSTVGSQVHIEFDSDETVDNWDDTHTWWDNFHHNGVDHGYYQNGVWISDGHERASEMINGSPVIVIGKLNLDTSHDAKTELHPVYAMFVRLKSSDFRRTSWAFFVRNWGDEGLCSDDDQPLDTREHKIRVKIPNVAGLISNNVSEGAQNEDQLSPMQVSMQPSGDGVLMTFTLLPPDKQSWFVGDLTFVARPPQSVIESTAPSAPPSGRNPNVAVESDERIGPDLEALEARIQKLPADSRKELERQLQSLTPRKKSFPVNVSVLFEPAKVEDTRPIIPAAVPPRGRARTESNSAAKLHRQKKVDFIKKYLLDKGVN